MSNFDEITEEKLNKMIQVLASLPPPEKPDKPLIRTPMEKCACGKLVDVTELEALDTGVFKTLNDICRGCKAGKQLDQSMARLVCANCKRVILRIKPATDKTGFTFKAGKTYHVAQCSLCNTELKMCKIIEKVLWDKKHQVH